VQLEEAGQEVSKRKGRVDFAIFNNPQLARRFKLTDNEPT
jgi:hypothetical protein